MNICVGSTNPVKINAVISAASETWPEVVVDPFDVPSGVPVQPIGEEQTRAGAQQRARLALEKKLQINQPGEQNRPGASPGTAPLLGIGLEGGVIEFDGQLWTTVWVAVVDQENHCYEANGSRFIVPEIAATRIRQGEEMGPVMADIISQHDVRSKQGMIGVITQGFVDRTEEYASIAKLALGIWFGRNWLAELPK